MPVAETYKIEDVLRECRYYIEKTGRRVIFEYALAEGVNCAPENAKELASRLRGMQCHVNPVKERDLTGATRRQAEQFQHELEALHISATIRREMGRDISGACGQLRRGYIKEHEETTHEETT